MASRQVLPGHAFLHEWIEVADAFIQTIFHAVNFIEGDPDVLIDMASEFQVISMNWIHFEISRAPTPFH